MRKLVVLIVLLGISAEAWSDSIFGVGGAFPNSVYVAWGKAYQAQTGNNLIYMPVGSGKGIAAILAKNTDFGASDMPLKLEELEKKQLVQFPTVMGGIVPTINLKGISDGQLLLDGNTLAAIYLGKITHWNDPALLALNPALNLPNTEIVVVHRADKSGTTFNVTNYLSKVSPEWKTSVGEGLTVQWPIGEAVDKLAGMAKKLANTPNSIGYLDMADAQRINLTYTKMKNHDGMIVLPSGKSFAAAAASAKWSAATGYYEILTNEPGAESWPITAATFILLERAPALGERSTAVIKLFDWAYRHGDQMASDFHYVPMPDAVKEGVRSLWRTQIKDKEGKAIW